MSVVQNAAGSPNSSGELPAEDIFNLLSVYRSNGFTYQEIHHQELLNESRKKWPLLADIAHYKNNINTKNFP